MNAAKRKPATRDTCKPAPSRKRKSLLDRIREVMTIELTAEQDDIPVRGNALASGDDALDRADEDAIIERLERGDVWAWASVTVKVTVGPLSATDHLGACSYKDEREFRADGYFEDMVNTCLDQLASQVGSLARLLELADE